MGGELMIGTLILFAVCFLGCMIQSITGFGYAIVAMSILPFFMPFKTAVATVAILALVMTIQLSIKLRKHVKIKILVIPLITSIIGRTLGVYIMVNINLYILRITLGILLILLSIWLFYFSRKVKIKASLASGSTAGLISGVVGGMCNISGPPLAIYYYAALENKKEYNATIQATFAISGIYTIILHFLYGNITYEVIRYSITGFIGVLLGTSFGLVIFNKINRDILGKAICLFVFVMGFVMLISELR